MYHQTMTAWLLAIRSRQFYQGPIRHTVTPKKCIYPPEKPLSVLKVSKVAFLVGHSFTCTLRGPKAINLAGKSRTNGTRNSNNKKGDMVSGLSALRTLTSTCFCTRF